MADSAEVDHLVLHLHDDNVSGASELARAAADILGEAALQVHAGSVDELRRALGGVGRRIVDAQPSMAPMVTLVRAVLHAVGDAGPPGGGSAGDHPVEAGRRAAARAAGEFRSGLEARTDAVVRAAAGLLPVGGTVGTISASGTVRRLLESRGSARGLRVVCFESRPMREGRVLAEALGRAGVEVLYAVDAAVGPLTAECDVVIFGADAVGDAGVTNKIGSGALTRAAREVGVPVHVLADETKLLPRGHPQALGDDRPREEVWADAPRDVVVWNRYFEVVPLELVTGVVTERGALDRDRVERLRRELEPLIWP